MTVTAQYLIACAGKRADAEPDLQIGEPNLQIEEPNLQIGEPNLQQTRTEQDSKEDTRTVG